MTKQTHTEENDLSHPKTPRQYLRLFLSGFAMGTADIIPGVSGGTMAFILGIYENLLDAIKSVDFDVLKMALKFDIKGIFEHVPYRFIIALGSGLFSAVFLLASLLHTLLEEQPTFIFAFFAGLIVASIVAIGLKVKWAIPAIGAFLVTAIFAFWLTGLSGEADYVADLVHAVRGAEEGEISADVQVYRVALIEQLDQVDYENATERVDALILAVQSNSGVNAIEDELDEALYQPSSPITLFFSGMVAICAMLLPGISGSFILLILGQYTVILGAVKTLDILPIISVGLGTVVGIMVFSRVISWLLKHYHNVTVAALVGFMAGSLRLIYTEAETGVSVVSPQTGTLDAGQIVLVIALIIIGFVGVSVLDHLQTRENPFVSLIWRPTAPPIDDIAEKATALE